MNSTAKADQKMKPRLSEILELLTEARNQESTTIECTAYLSIITDILIEFGKQEGLIEDDLPGKYKTF